MKTILISFLLFVAGLCTAQSFQRKTPEQKARKYTDELKALTPLDSVSEEKIFQINVQVSRQIDSLYAAKPDKNDMRKAFAILFSSRDTAFRRIMNTEQFLRYDDWQRELREKRLREKQEREKQQSLLENGAKEPEKRTPPIK